jgi:hypothetical protein
MSPAAPVEASKNGPASATNFVCWGIAMTAALLLANAAAWIVLAMALIIVERNA